GLSAYRQCAMLPWLMALYAILSVPLLMYLYFGLGVLSRPLDVPIFRRPLLKGVASVPLFAAVLAMISLSLEKQFSLEGLFRYYLLRDALIIPYLVTGAALLACRKLLLRGDWELFTGMLVYSGVVYALLAFVDLILGGFYLGIYDLFLKPTLRLSGLTLLTAAVVTVIRQYGATRWIAVLAILVFPPAYALAGALEASVRVIPAILITLFVAFLAAGTIRLGPFLGYVRPRPE
ncbi:MAG: hypothetical protein ACLFNP_03555, partial [Spirochaetaceae bacterium]